MSYSFLNNLWDTDETAAYTAHQSNPGGRSYSVQPPRTTATAQMASSQMAASQMTAVAPPVAAGPAASMGVMYPQPVPQQRQEQAFGAHQGMAYDEDMAMNPHFARSVPNDSTTELKQLLKATIIQLQEGQLQQYQKLQYLRKNRSELTGSIQNLSYILYGLIAVCFLMAIVLVALFYKVHMLSKKPSALGGISKLQLP